MEKRNRKRQEKYINSYVLEAAFPSDSKCKVCLYGLFISASLIFCAYYFTGSAFFAKDYKIFPGWMAKPLQMDGRVDNCQISQGQNKVLNVPRGSKSDIQCLEKCRPVGSEALPEGIVTKTSSLETRSLGGSTGTENKLKHPKNLLVIPVGIKQKHLVNKIVEKFLGDDFVVMLFHYDGIVDEWNDLEWSSHVIHVSVVNQSKWWFAKRFLHPDIVAEYDYIFLWDEDLGVESFHPDRYLSIIKEEGLEISQPALDPSKSEVHHQITARLRRSRVHRRFYKFKGGGQCDQNSTAPPCVGWVEMMAPVFSRAAWRCSWYMIQNDLIHAWGLDKQLGYCAQGDRTRRIGVVDAEYIVHLGLPTLGGFTGVNKSIKESTGDSKKNKNLENSEESVVSTHADLDDRFAVRRQSYMEMKIFKNRWDNAVKADKCWADPYQKPAVQLVH